MSIQKHFSTIQVYTNQKDCVLFHINVFQTHG